MTPGREEGHPLGRVLGQYSGIAGQIEKCQIGVFVACASQTRHALIDRLSLGCMPDSWTRRPGPVPDRLYSEEVGFATNRVLAQAMLQRAIEASVPFSCHGGRTRLDQ
jgi:SRSO17 transposase